MSVEAGSRPPQIIKCYEAAERKALAHYPYVFDGGHGPGFGPTKGGYDCSGWACSVLDAGGILESGEPHNTAWLQRWGAAGQGQYMTLWVHNSNVFEHCFFEFKLGNPAKRWSQAEKSGTICGWFPFMPTTGYTPRRRK